MDKDHEASEVLSKQPTEDSDALESALQHVGEFGRYQKWLFVAMAPFGFIFAFVYFGQMFIVPTPQDHWCLVPALRHLDVEVRRNLSMPFGVERCKMFDANWSQVLWTMQPPANGTPLVPCRHGWEFQYHDIPYSTVVSERGWVCEYSGYAPIAQTVFFVGSIVGGLVFGWLADRYGRVPALVGTNLVGCVGGIACIFTTGLWDFAFCRFLVGMAHDSCFMMLYILVLEYVGPRYRTWAGNMSFAVFFGGGCLALPWVAVWIADWRKLVLASSLPMLIVVAAPFVLPESARWLASQGRVSQAVDVLRKFERVNGKKIPQDILDEFVLSSNQSRQTDESITALFKSPPLRLVILLMVTIYMVCALIFDGLIRMSEGLGMDFFVTFTITSATEIPSIFLLVLVLDRWGRKLLATVPMVVAGCITLVAGFVPKGIAQVTLATLGRFTINMSFNTVVQWATEVLPTGMRASGSSLIHVSGFVATLLSPFIVYSEKYWTPLPLVILGLTALAAASIGMLLPETKGKPMPQTIVDGERLVREHSLCGKPEKETELQDMRTGKEESLT